MKTDACPKCGSTDRQRGKIYHRGTLADMRFKADDAPALSFKEQVTVLACSECGYLELFLTDHET